MPAWINSNFSALRKLRLRGCTFQQQQREEGAGATIPEPLPVESLCIEGEDTPPLAWLTATLGALPRLTSLTLNPVNSDEVTAALSAVSGQLTHLELTRASRGGYPGQERSFLTQPDVVAKLRHLQHLDIRCFELDDEHFSVLQTQLPALEVVKVSGCTLQASYADNDSCSWDELHIAYIHFSSLARLPLRGIKRVNIRCLVL
jgi:hypothetical protein